MHENFRVAVHEIRFLRALALFSTLELSVHPTVPLGYALDHELNLSPDVELRSTR